MFRSLLLFAVAGSVGCSGQQSPPAPSDPATARATLVKVLDAWKGGESLDAFKATNPTITPVNRPWQQGLKLSDYTIDEKTEMSGYDVRFTVRETTADGKKSSEKATYNVSTTPKLVVVRTEPGG
jgi:hypothetical protein